MNEPVIDIRDRIEKMRNQMTPQSSEKQAKSLQKSSNTHDHKIDKVNFMREVVCIFYFYSNILIIF